MPKADLMSQRKTLAILRILRDHGHPMGASRIAHELAQQGLKQSERMVRIYLERMDRQGLTENLGRPGRALTRKGISEISKGPVVDKVGFVNVRTDALTYQMTFDLASRNGTLVVNVSQLPIKELPVAIRVMESVFEQELGMGNLVAFAKPGQRMAGQVVPDDCVMIGTVCSLTANGVFLKHGIPTVSVFGGLLEIHDRQPARFVHIIRYDGSTLDPLEIFIQGLMTSVSRAVAMGHGLIGVGFREVPSSSRERIVQLQEDLFLAGLGKFLLIGDPNQPVLDIPVPYGRMGILLQAGLNPIAAAHECGVPTRNVAMCALMEYRDLVHYSQLRSLL